MLITSIAMRHEVPQW